jgi:endonuclease G
MHIGTVSSSARYAGNAEFGEPADADASDDYILRYPQFTSSFNKNRSTPNWVSYNLEATHFGPEDRCDCFTFDRDLPATFPRYTTADYTGVAAINGYGIDRGHLARSADRTGRQSRQRPHVLLLEHHPPGLGQQPGAVGDHGEPPRQLRQGGDREVYVIAGVAGSKGTVKHEGKIVIPAYVWKVAVIMSRDQGLAHVRSAATCR